MNGISSVNPNGTARCPVSEQESEYFLFVCVCQYCRESVSVMSSLPDDFVYFCESLCIWWDAVGPTYAQKYAAKDAFHSCALTSKDQDILDTNVNLYTSINSVPRETQGDFLSKWVVPFFVILMITITSFLYVINIQIEAATQTANVLASWFI